MANLLVDRRYANADFPISPPCWRPFSPKRKPSRAVGGGCLALAGPIADDGASARLTNLPWTIDSADLSRRFGLPALRLVNDFAGAAMGAVTSSAGAAVTLQQGARWPRRPASWSAPARAWAWPSCCPKAVAGASSRRRRPCRLCPRRRTAMALWAFLRGGMGA
jgi:hypothetical protein